MYNKNSNNDKTNYKFYCSVSADSPYWPLAKYFQFLGSAQSKEKMLTAANAYWQPMAAQYGREDTFSVKGRVSNSIYRLQNQINYLQSLKFKLLPSPALTNESLPQEAIPLELRCRINPDFLYWGLLNYFQSKESTFTEEEMILWSSIAYWQPLALFHLGLCNQEQEWRETVSESVKFLKQHLKYLQNTFDVDSPPEEVRETQLIESPTNKVISLSDQKTPTPYPDVHTASSSTENSVQADSTPSEDETKTEPVEQKEQINWIEQIDDPLLKPRESDEMFAQMFENIGKK